MKASYIDYSETGSFQETILRYLNGDENLSPFISAFPSLSAIGESSRTRKTTGNREILATVLESQYAALGLAPDHAVAKNIASLRQQHTFTVTTGHQLNIFTGPLYFLYKIVSAINLARELKAANPGSDFVPVYWMASEDHDFEEINHTVINGKKVEWQHQETGATGRMSTSSMQETVGSYVAALGLGATAGELTALVKEAYLGHSTLAAATRALVHALFGAYGLVIIDADDPNLKRQFAPFIERDILEQISYKAISRSTEALTRAGFSTQVNAREINFFYMKDNLRERIVVQDGRYFVLNSSLEFSREELVAEIRQYPERFSPNVVMRPLYQEILLPNLAYIGGGAEVVYWLQLKENFDRHGIDFPILLLRNSALLSAAPLSSRLTKMDLTLRDLFQDEIALKKNWTLRHSGKALHLHDEWEQFEAVFEAIGRKAIEIDNTLLPSTEAVKARLKHAVIRLEHKLLRAEQRNHATSLDQLSRLKEELFPGGKLQERKENFGTYYLRYGQELIPGLIGALKPLDFKFTILEP
jgi:bacillithiol synthase